MLNGITTGVISFNRCTDYVYNYPLFSFSNLDPNTLSNLTVYDWGPPSTLLLDYLEYDNGISANASKAFPVAAVVVPLCAIALLLALISFLLYRRKKDR
jgi:hypothetical protein